MPSVFHPLFYIQPYVIFRASPNTHHISCFTFLMKSLTISEPKYSVHLHLMPVTRMAGFTLATL